MAELTLHRIEELVGQAYERAGYRFVTFNLGCGMERRASIRLATYGTCRECNSGFMRLVKPVSQPRACGEAE